MTGKTLLKNYLKEFRVRLKPSEANNLKLPRISKIDFNGNIHLKENIKTNTDMLLVKPGMLVVSGINAEKGAVSVYEGKSDALTTIHYSVYENNPNESNIQYLKNLCRSQGFKESLNEKRKAGIKTEVKPEIFLDLELEIERSLQLQEEILSKFRKRQKLIEKVKTYIEECDSQSSYLIESFFQKRMDRFEEATNYKNFEEILLNKLKNGVSPKEVSEPDVSGIKSFSLAATSSGFFNFEKTKNVDLKEVDAEKYFLKKGDILIQRGNAKNFVGVSAVFYGEEKAFIYPDLMIKVSLKNNFLPEFVHMFLMSSKVRSYFREVASGTNDTMIKINQQKIMSLKIPDVCLREQEVEVSIYKDFVKKYHVFLSQLDQLKEARSHLLN